MDRESHSAPVEPSAPVATDALPSIEQLTAIWSRALRVSPLSPNDDFFELGGDSLLAVTLMLEIERETGCSIPFTAIYDAPSVASQWAFLNGERHSTSGPLVRLKEGGNAPPFYLVHGIGGTVMEFSALGQAMSYDGEMYGVQARGLDGREPPLDSVEGMAGHYLDAILEKQPCGPYFVGGYSFGGLVALEISRQLRAQRKEVGALVMIDSYGHPGTWPFATRIGVRWRRLQRRRARLAEMPFRETASYFAQTAKLLSSRLVRKPDSEKDWGGNAGLRWLRVNSPRLPTTLREVRDAGVRAVHSYTPRYYPGEVMFLRAALPDPDFPTQPGPVWRHLLGDIEIQTVEGNHFTVIGEHVHSIAQHLSRILNGDGAARAVVSTLPAATSPQPAPNALEGVPC